MLSRESPEPTLKPGNVRSYVALRGAITSGITDDNADV